MTATTQRPLDSYETELLDELRREVRRRGGALPVSTSVASLAVRRPVRRWLPAGAGIAAAAMLVIGSVQLLTPRPAYALASVDDGSVQVTISRAEDAAGLQRALAEKGFSARVDYLPFDQMCAPLVGIGGGGAYLYLGTGEASRRSASNGRIFTITKAMGSSGSTALITLSGPADSGRLTVDVVTGVVGPCNPVPTNRPATGSGPAPSAPPSAGSSAGGR